MPKTNYYYDTPRKIKAKNHTAKRVGMLIAAVLALVLVLCLFRGCSDEAGLSIPDNLPGIVFDESAVFGGWEELTKDEIEANLNEQLAEGLINISMNTSPYFEDGTSKGNLMIVNETINRYPQKVEIIRNDTEEVIYTSGAIPVGSKIEAAKLDVELDAGEYECTALFHNLNPDTGAILGTAGAIITITIKD